MPDALRSPSGPASGESVQGAEPGIAAADTSSGKAAGASGAEGGNNLCRLEHADCVNSHCRPAIGAPCDSFWQVDPSQMSAL